MISKLSMSEDLIRIVIRDLSALRGAHSPHGGKRPAEQTTALIPVAELLTYATTLNSLTAGWGSYAMEFSRCDKVPHELAVRFIETHKGETYAAAH